MDQTLAQYLESKRSFNRFSRPPASGNPLPPLPRPLRWDDFFDELCEICRKLDEKALATYFNEMKMWEDREAGLIDAAASWRAERLPGAE